MGRVQDAESKEKGRGINGLPREGGMAGGELSAFVAPVADVAHVAAGDVADVAGEM
jgi:hypothetical protein